MPRAPPSKSASLGTLLLLLLSMQLQVRQLPLRQADGSGVQLRSSCWGGVQMEDPGQCVGAKWVDESAEDGRVGG